MRKLKTITLAVVVTMLAACAQQESLTNQIPREKIVPSTIGVFNKQNAYEYSIMFIMDGIPIEAIIEPVEYSPERVMQQTDSSYTSMGWFLTNSDTEGTVKVEYVCMMTYIFERGMVRCDNLYLRNHGPEQVEQEPDGKD